MKRWMALVALLVVACQASAVCGQAFNPGAQQAIAEIEALGGKVYPLPNGDADIVAMTGRKFGDEHLDLLLAISTVRRLNLDGSRVSDAGLEKLLKLPKLEEVSLLRTAVTQGAADALKDQHPGVYSVALSAGTRPAMFGVAAALLIPFGFGLWLISLTRKKRAVLAPALYLRGMLWGFAVMAICTLMIVVALLQAMGIEFRLADLFG
ncbi:hypothetical protein ETAA8_02880 [Anatilimnocola aggregata]|uniref:Uncharacterized protein n=1 Tax=Anatilimnocola aggregata TaxID=2528021 RepID=A0A517Y4R8_9BACT|nr:hypothetical protein [Anatilimnocola aggregata]QDU25225.1 hypothetical protein ETAA8_02880 [Anatilimnocola aggregata]